MRRVLKTQKFVGAGILGIQTLNYDDFLSDVSQRLREELDYKHEARNIDIFRRIYRDWDWLTVPRVFPEFSTERVLTMDLLEGDGRREGAKGFAHLDHGVDAVAHFRVAGIGQDAAMPEGARAELHSAAVSRLAYSQKCVKLIIAKAMQAKKIYS